MKLSIVITHYQEPLDVFRPMLDSLQLQQAVDWSDIEILFVQDGKTGCLRPSDLKRWNLPIRYSEQPKGGISRARNKGMDETTGDYIMFCDCDDMFQNLFGLHLLFSAMNEDPSPDIIGSKFVEENKHVAAYKLIGHENDQTFIHGKAFKRSFLEANNLRFHDEITKHEDAAFVFVAFQLTKNAKHINTPFYLWRWNENSVMRSIGVDRALILTYPELMLSHDVIAEDLKARGLDYDFIVAKTVMDTYYDFQKAGFADSNTAEFMKAFTAFGAFFNKYKAEWERVPGDLKAQVMMASRTVAYQNGMQFERMSLGQFLSLFTDVSVQTENIKV